jgi:peptidoglycan/LPS O-acetylase OafA/YrhL
VVAARAPHLFEVRSERLQATLKRIGLMTYPMFLVHNVLGAGIIRAAVGLGVNQWAALAMAVIAAIGLAYVICATAEVEVRRRLRTALNAADRLIRKGLARPQSAPGP